MRPADLAVPEEGNADLAVPRFRSVADWLHVLPPLILAILLFVRPSFPLDDAYITLHNARVLLAGGADGVYAGATALTGATSAVHLILIAALGAVLPIELASKLVSLIAILLYAAGLVALLRRLECPPAARLVLFAAGLFIGYTPYHLLNGLETGLALAAIAWAFVLIDNRWLPLLCGVLPFIRPELAFLAAPLLLRRFWLDRRNLRALLAAAGLALAGAAPWLLLYTFYTGWPVPNTGGAKIAFFAEGRLSWTERAETLAKVVIPSLLGPLWLALPRLWRGPAGHCALVFLACWVGLTAYVFPSGFHHNYFRYVSLVVPVLLLGWGMLLARAAVWHWPALATLLIWTVLSSIPGIQIYLDRSHTGALDRTARFIDANLPRDAVILVHDAGYLAWTLPHRHLVDAVGLKTPTSTQWHRLYTARSGTPDMAMHRIASDARAGYLVALADKPLFWGRLATGLERSGWLLHPLTPVRDHAYVVYRLTPPSRPAPAGAQAAPQPVS